MQRDGNNQNLPNSPAAEFRDSPLLSSGWQSFAMYGRDDIDKEDSKLSSAIRNTSIKFSFDSKWWSSLFTLKIVSRSNLKRDEFQEEKNLKRSSSKR